MWNIDPSLLFIILLVSGFLLFFLAVVQGEKSSKKRDEKEKKERQHAGILSQLAYRAETLFGVEFDTIQEDDTQDEVVRIVNLLAFETATACVDEDKSRRNGSKFGRGEVKDVTDRKIEWSKARNFALLIAPELKDRLPHFSELEPLKSYNAEHLRQKAKKRASSI